MMKLAKHIIPTTGTIGHAKHLIGPRTLHYIFHKANQMLGMTNCTRGWTGLFFSLICFNLKSSFDKSPPCNQNLLTLKFPGLCNASHPIHGCCSRSDTRFACRGNRTAKRMKQTCWTSILPIISCFLPWHGDCKSQCNLVFVPSHHPHSICTCQLRRITATCWLCPLATWDLVLSGSIKRFDGIFQYLPPWLLSLSCPGLP